MEIERRVTVIVLQHTLHRLNEFFDEHVAEELAEYADDVAIASAFAQWLSDKDRAI